MNLRYRVLLVAGLIAASLFALYPRQVVERVRGPNGFVYDTVQRVPLKRGLDLQGGMHLALEVDESKGRVADKVEALDRALKVVRTRIDQFGVSEPLVQKSGDDRIIVELPGIDDPQRAQDVVQKSAFLEFQITDESQALDKVLPRLDGIIRARGLTAPGARTPAGTTPAQTPSAGLGGLLQRDTTDTSRVAADTARSDTAAVAAGTGPG